jgi:small subunit ribosomal protein S17
MARRTLLGTVVGDKADKTVVVQVERRVRHPLYGKFIRRSKKMHVHDEQNRCGVGDVVRIQECAPKSKTKTWEVVSDALGNPPGGGGTQ